MKRLIAFTSAILLAGTAAVAAQPNPIVKMTVTPPTGSAQELSAPESGLATFALKDGTEIGVRPTILDAKPWARVTVTFFKMPTTSHASEEIGSVEAKTGGAAVTAKTSPAFKVAVVSVSEPNTAATMTTTR